MGGDQNGLLEGIAGCSLDHDNPLPGSKGARHRESEADRLGDLNGFRRCYRRRSGPPRSLTVVVDRLRGFGHSGCSSARRVRFHRDARSEGVSWIPDPVPDARGLNTASGPRLKAESLLKIVSASAFFVSATCFNVPNHPIFGQPDTSPGSPTYGVI